MKTQQLKTSKITVIGGIILIALVAVLIGRMRMEFASNYDAVTEPANSLPKNLAALERLGVVTSGAQVNFSELELIEDFQTASWRKPSKVSPESSDIARELFKNKNLLEKLSEQSAMTVGARLPSHRDFLEKQSSLATQRATASLITFVNEAIENNQLEDALSGIEMMFAFQDSVIPSSSEASVVYWFACNTDILRLISTFIEQPGVTSEMLTRIRTMISSKQRVPDLYKIAIRYATEMVLFSRHLDSLDQGEEEALYFSTSGLEIPDLQQPDMHSAIQSKVAAAWVEILEAAKHDTFPEELGVEMDYVVSDFQLSDSKVESDYLIAAIPLKFELIGRMITRVLQGRAVLNVALNGQLKQGSITLQMGSYEVPVEISRSQDNWILVSKGMAPNSQYNFESGLEINQSQGVRLFLKRENQGN